MATHIADTLLHIDEPLESWQHDVLEQHMRMQNGVIGAGHSNNSPHVMMITYNPRQANAVKFIHLVEREGFHAVRIG